MTGEQVDVPTTADRIVVRVNNPHRPINVLHEAQQRSHPCASEDLRQANST